MTVKQLIEALEKLGPENQHLPVMHEGCGCCTMDAMSVIINDSSEDEITALIRCTK